MKQLILLSIIVGIAFVMMIGMALSHAYKEISAYRVKPKKKPGYAVIGAKRYPDEFYVTNESQCKCKFAYMVIGTGTFDTFTDTCSKWDVRDTIPSYTDIFKTCE